MNLGLAVQVEQPRAGGIHLLGGAHGLDGHFVMAGVRDDVDQLHIAIAGYNSWKTFCDNTSDDKMHIHLINFCNTTF